MNARIVIVALVVFVGACAAPATNAPVDTAASASAPLHPVSPAYTQKDVLAGSRFLASHSVAQGVGGHEFDGVVLGMARSHDKPNSLRVVVLARDGTVWIVDPVDDSFADDIASLVGKGDWVIVHKHQVEGTMTEIQSDHDLRLVEKAGAS